MSKWKRERRRQERDAWRDKYGAEAEANEP
jgi:hypothetical protein